MQTLVFVLAGTRVSAVRGQRPEDVRGGAPGDHRRLIRAGLVAHGG
jgi:hypothetical protein